MMLALLASAILAQAVPPDPERVDALRAEAETLEEEAQARRAEADVEAVQIADLQRRLVQAAERVRVREAEAEAAFAELNRLEAEENALSARLVDERTGLARVLAALQRIESADPPAIAVNPEDAAEAARAAALLAHLAPELQARAASVRDQLAELAALRESLQGQAELVTEAEAALTQTRSEVDALIAQRQAAEAALRAEAAALSRQAADIARQARDLDALIGEIRRYAAATPRLAPRQEPGPAAPTPGTPIPRLRPEPASPGTLVDAQPLDEPAETLRFADMRGRLRPPARGELAIGAGEPGPGGVIRPGVWFETSPGAQVSAPFDGVVVYAGPFQSFDGVLMINTPDGYTLVLGGLALLFASEGQSLLAGEPVGVMSDRETPSPMLYLEIRRSTDAADDPEAWLRPEYRRG